MPLARLLSQIGRLSPSHSNLHVHVSGALCPAHPITFPTGISSWVERDALARSWSAQRLGLQVEDFDCSTGQMPNSYSATLAHSIRSELQQWATQQNCKLASIRPLWATATHWKIAKKSSTKILILQEPDGTTILVDTPQHGLSAESVLGRHDEQRAIDGLARMRDRFPTQENEIALLGFSAKTTVTLPNGPALWAEHWYAS